jgi:hypothetical protein
MMRGLAFLVAAGVSLLGCLQLLGLPATTTAKADIAFAAPDPRRKRLPHREARAIPADSPA